VVSLWSEKALWNCWEHRRIESLNELVITTNGSQLETMATALKEAGVKRINISLDTLDADNLRQSPERVIYSKYSEVFKPPSQSL